MNESDVPRFDPDRHTEAIALRASGLTLQAIADRLGVSARRVRAMLAQGPLTGLERRARARFPDLHPRIAQRLAARFPDDAALRAASDAELLSLRGVGPSLIPRIRAHCPRGD